MMWMMCSWKFNLLLCFRSKHEHAMEPKTLTSRTDHQVDHSLLTALEEQQEWFAHLLHRTLCQSFSGISLTMRLLERSGQPASPENPQWLDLRQTVSGTMRELHAIMDCLRAAPSQQAPLPLALRELATARGIAFDCDASADTPALQADSPLARTLYFIANIASVQPSETAASAMRLEQGEGSILLVIQRAASPEGETPSQFLQPLLELRAKAVGADCVMTRDEISITFPASNDKEVPCAD